MERLAPLNDVLIPEARAILTAIDQVIRDATTPEQRDDLLRHLGSFVSVHAGPGGKWGTVPTFLVEYHDAEGLERTLATLVAAINANFRKRTGIAGDGQPLAITLEKLPAPDRGYRLVSPDGQVAWLTADLQPTILVGKTYLVLAANPNLARAAIAAENRPEERWKPTGEVAQAIGCLPANLAFLSVGNPRDSFWPEMVANFPQTAAPFLNKFIGFPVIPEADAPPAPDALDVLGIPRVAGQGPRPPRADELRPLIQPSILAATVEDRSFRVISLESLPLGCFGLEAHYDPQGRGRLDFRGKTSPAR